VISTFHIASSEIPVFTGFSVLFGSSRIPDKVNEKNRYEREVNPGFLVKLKHDRLLIFDKIRNSEFFRN